MPGAQCRNVCIEVKILIPLTDLLEYKTASFFFNWELISSKYRGGFAIHSHESAMGVHVFPILTLPSYPSWLSQCTGFECPASCFELGLVIYFTYGNIHVSVLFSQIISPLPSPTESKSLFFTSVSLLLSLI